MDPVDAHSLFLSAAEGLLGRLVRCEPQGVLFPGGRNGPHFDLESPIRNSSHALSAMSIAFRLTEDRRFEESGRRLADFILSADGFSANGIHLHRQRPGKDCCNGVIGPAWVIEALALAGRLLGHVGARARAKELSEAQPFSQKAALWERRDPCGGRARVDRTLNHQASFATSIQLALDETHPNVCRFLDHLAAGGLRVDASGQIVHHVPRNDEVQNWARGQMERILRAGANSNHVDRIRRRDLTDRHKRDTGYHIYSLFTLARLYGHTRDHPLWQSTSFTRALALPLEPAWIEALDENRYAYPYNGPGLELPLVAVTFGERFPGLWNAASHALKKQVALTWDFESKAFTRGSEDPLTLTARSYELGLAFV